MQWGGGGISFPIGNLGTRSSGHDRFLKISIANRCINIVNDYAGSIPVYYSLRNHLSLSNIEPCVVIDSKTTCDDLSWENIYGYLRFMHFIWDETAYKHINMTLPDSETVFDLDTLSVKTDYLATVSSTMTMAGKSDKDVASKLYELNASLVESALKDYDKVVLPLSSGYDSRMIFAVLASNKKYKDKLNCYTYGGSGSIEVEAAKQMAKLFAIHWSQINFPCLYLKKDRIQEVLDVFGDSLHVHGMYQLEFFEEICRTENNNLPSNSCLTSGFMTGVPAGQHNFILNIKNDAERLVEAMNNFTQSKTWYDSDLEQFSVFANKNFIEAAEERFRKAFNRFDGEIFQKSVVFDIWTRQRNFIGYYPRTLEWEIPVVSPHMNTGYINFFMSLGREHLENRKSVELMFAYYYPKLAGIFSNSNGIRTISNQFENTLLFVSRVLRKLKLYSLIPQKYQNKFIDFDIVALNNVKEEAIYPLFEFDQYGDNCLGMVFRNEIDLLYRNAIAGDSRAYQQLILLQPLVWSSIYCMI